MRFILILAPGYVQELFWLIFKSSYPNFCRIAILRFNKFVVFGSINFLFILGHFGSVYLGQLRLKGNILKTVAVKTLKGKCASQT